MKVLFDQGVPVPLRNRLPSHDVDTAYELGWSDLENEVLVTTDQNLKYQQNFTGRSIAIVVLLSTSWPKIQTQIDAIDVAINAAASGDYVEVPI